MAWISSAAQRGLIVSGDRGDFRRRLGFIALPFNDLTDARQLLRLTAVMQISVLLLAAPLLLSSPLLTLLLAGGLVSGLVLLQVATAPEVKQKSHGQDEGTDTCPDVVSTHSFDGALTQVQLHRAPADGFVQSEAWIDLMARVSHDLRTPLNAVIGFSDLMENEAFGPLGSPRYQEYTRHIRDSGKALLKSAEDTLVMTSVLTDPDAGSKLVPVSLGNVVRDAWAFIESAHRSRDLCLQVSGVGKLDVMSEPRALRQILLNLLSEACQRAKTGALIRLHVTAVGDRVQCEISVCDCAEKEDGSEPSGKAIRGHSNLGSLALCVARTLLEVQGSPLYDYDGGPSGWRAVTLFDRAVQDDFFTTPKVSPALAHAAPTA